MSRIETTDESRGRILVTGVSGFVGAAVARAFARHGYAVRGMVRGSSIRTNLDDFPGEVVEADMRDPHAVASAMEGMDFLAHVAADYRLWARDPEEIVRNNRAGTQTMLLAAREAGVRRIVYTSSVASASRRAGRWAWRD